MRCANANGTLATLNDDALVLQKSQTEASLAKAKAALAQIKAQLVEAKANADEAVRARDWTRITRLAAVSVALSTPVIRKEHAL